MASLTIALAEILQTVQRPGDFSTTGTLDILAPRLDVGGVGPMALPRLPVQAQPLLAVAAPAPYGRGDATLVDTEGRRTWQSDPARVQLGGRHGAQTLADLVARATAGLGGTGPVYGRSLPTPGVRSGEFLREPSRYREGRWHVRPPHHRVAVHLYRRRPPGPPSRSGSAA